MATSTRSSDASSSAARRRPRFGGRCLVASIALHGLAFAALTGTWSGVEAGIGRRGPIDFEISLSMSEFVVPAESGDLMQDVATSTGAPVEAPPEPPVPDVELPAESARALEPPADPPRAFDPVAQSPLELLGANETLPESPLESNGERPQSVEPADESSETANASEQAPSAAQASAAGGSEPALWLEGPDPAYPRLSVRYGEEGVVVCRLAIAADGSVRDVTVISSSGHARLDRAAVDALSRWRFRAAREGGEPIPVELVHRVVFRLSSSR